MSQKAREGARALRTCITAPHDEHSKIGFLLQDHYVKEFTENLQLHLLVKDADAWWAQINPTRFHKNMVLI